MKKIIEKDKPQSWTAEDMEKSSLDKWHENMINKYMATTKENPNYPKDWSEANSANAVERANHIAASEERGKLIPHKENAVKPYINFARKKCFALIKKMGEKTNEIVTYQIDGDAARISRMVWHTEDNDFNEVHCVHEVAPELSRNHWRNRVNKEHEVFPQELWPSWLFWYFDNEVDE